MIASRLWSLKLRLQFTGLLQYMPPIMLAIALVPVAALAWRLGLTVLAYPLLLVAATLLIVSALDLLTVKFHLHPREPLPERNDDLDVFDLMRARHSCRSFQDRKLTPADYRELMHYVQLRSESPMIGNATIRFEYVSAPLTVWPVVGATEFLVAIAPHQYNRLAIVDIGRSLQKIVIDATRMGLGTCWIGPGANQSSVIQHLGDCFNREEDHVICVCAVGYESRYKPLLVRFMNANFHRRLPLSSLFVADPCLREPLDLESYPFRRFGRTYEVCQWSPSSYNGQTTRCVAVMEQTEAKGGEIDGQEACLARFDFYATTNSHFYTPVAVGIWCANWEVSCEALGIPGRFACLSAEEGRVDDEEARCQPPTYDASWILNKKLLGEPHSLRPAYPSSDLCSG